MKKLYKEKAGTQGPLPKHNDKSRTGKKPPEVLTPEDAHAASRDHDAVGQRTGSQGVAGEAELL